MEILLFDRSEKQIGRLLPDLVSPTEIEDLGGEHRLIFSYPSDADWAENIAEGYLVACWDMDRNWQLYEISEVQDGIGTVEATCNHAYYALAGMEYVSAACEGSAMLALDTVLAGTGWEPGTVEIQTARTIRFEYVNPLAAVTEIASVWGGELHFRVDISGTRITNKYVDLLTRRGDVTGKRFEFGRDVKDIDITVDRTDIVTALYGWGQGEAIDEEADETERLTVADAEWVEGEEAELHPDGLTSPAPTNKPLGRLWVGDEEARLAYGRYDPSIGEYRHIFGEYESQAHSPQALLWETWRQLQKRNAPLVNIKATVADLEQIPGFEHEKVRLGDTCYIILPDISPLAARVIRIVRQRKDPGQTQIEMGNFRPVQGERISDIERRVKRADGRSGVWDRAQAFDPDGTLPASVLDGPIEAVQNQIKAGGGHVLVDAEGFRVLDTDDPQTALGKIHGVARDGEAALILGKRDSPIDPWGERVGMTSDGFRFHANEVVAGTFTGDRLHIGPGVGFDTGYDPSTKETPSGAQQKADDAASAAEQAAKDYAEDRIPYKVDIFSTGGLVFKNGVIQTTLIARVYKGKEDITDQIDSNHFRWTRISDDPAGDEAWNDANYGGSKQIVVTQDDVFARATFVCEVRDFGGLVKKWALSFDGMGDYINIPVVENDALDIRNSITMEARIYREDITNEEYVLSKNASGGFRDQQYALFVGKDNGYKHFVSVINGEQVSVNVNPEMIENKWIYYSTTWDGEIIKIYLDGNLIASQPYSGDIVYKPNLYIGKRNPSSNPYKGKVSEIRIWNTARTQQEIQDNMNTKLTGNELGLVGYWPLDEGTGTTAHDLSGNGNHGEIHGATWVEVND